VNRNLHRCHTRFARTAAEAFKDASYATAIERHRPASYGAAWWVAISLIGVVGLVLAVATK
jgi:hypothetical protein